MMLGVRALVIALVLGSSLTGCGTRKVGSGGPPTTAPAQVVTVFPAARFVPAKPSYVVSARSMRDAQASYTHLVDMLGMVAGFEVSEVSRELTSILGVDPLSADAVAAIGVDLDGSVAVFSEDMNPTFVLHLKAPDAMQGFLEGQRQDGLRTQSVIVAGTEVYTSKLDSDADISWAIDGDWMWIHFSFGGADDASWFERSKQPTGAAWVDGWSWAKGQGSSPVVGVFEPGSMLAKLAAQAQQAAACAKQLAAVRRIGLNFDIDAKQAAVRLAVDLGDASARLASVLLAPPPGWTAASANAPIHAQWNVDLPTVATFVQSCTGEDDMRVGLDQVGVRSFRAFAHSLDIGDKEGVGAVSVDLSSAAFFKGMLDQVPGRGMAESNRTFGQYKGKHLKVPFFLEADYVLNEQVAIGAMGKGVLETIGSGAAPAGPPAVMLVDVRPQGMPAGVWQDLFGLLDLPDPKRLTQRLMLWTELHADAVLDGSSLIITARGIRR